MHDASNGQPHGADDEPAPDEVVWIYPSRLKTGFLVLPCVLAVVMILQADNAPGFALAELGAGRIAALLIAIAVGGLVLHMAFERDPVLILDDEGIHCRRPPIGLIPWTAVTGAAAGKGLLMRRVLMIAAERHLLPPQARTFAERSSGIVPFFSPQLGRFSRQARGQACFFIPISLMSMRTAEIEHHVQAFVQRHVADA